MNKKAVILLSGGLDSATVLAIAQDSGFETYALSFNYGQKHNFELTAAKKISEYFAVAKHLTLNVDLRAIGGSALTDDIEVPQHQADGSTADRIPVTYVPARNTIFLSIALGWAEVLGANDIFIGANAIDYSGYPDCRLEYITAFEKMANLATKAGVEGNKLRIQAPIISLSKAQIIQKGMELGVDYAMTHSCYNLSDDGKACGLCDSCLLRKKGIFFT